MLYILGKMWLNKRTLGSIPGLYQDKPFFPQIKFNLLPVYLKFLLYLKLEHPGWKWKTHFLLQPQLHKNIWKSNGGRFLLKTQDSSDHVRRKKCPECFLSIFQTARNHREIQILLLNHVPLTARSLNTKKWFQAEEGS